MFSYAYISIFQRINNNVTLIGKNKYEVKYILNGKPYKMIITPHRGPSPILQITDHNFTDITDHILPYMGPRYDWHGYEHEVCLDMLGVKSLTFEFADGTTNVVINKKEK